MAYATHTHIHGASILDRATQVIADLGARFAKYKMYRQTFVELSDLSTRELDDLGISRADIQDVALAAAYGK